MNKINKFWQYCFLIFFALVPMIFISMPVWLACLTIFAIIWVCCKYKLTKFPLILFIVAFAVRLAFNLIVRTPPISDFGVLYNAAKSILVGDLTFNSSRYFYLWAYQIGFVGFQALLLKIWDSLFFLKVINCLISSTICLLVYLIAKEFVKEKSARIVALIYAFLPFTITYTSVLTNQHFSTLLIYLALYLIVSDKIRTKYLTKYIYIYIISGVLIGVANVIRPEGVVTILAICLALLLNLKKGHIQEIIISLVVLLVFYFGSFKLIEQVLIKTDLAPYGLTNNAPYWKFVLGLNHETMGRYDNRDVYLLNEGNEGKAQAVIKERLLVRPYMYWDLFDNKIRTFWNSTSLEWSFHHLVDVEFDWGIFIFKVNDAVAILQKCSSFIVFVLYIFLWIGWLMGIRHKKINPKIYFIMNQVFVSLEVYLFIEVQPRYSYYIQVSVAILAALGIDYFTDFYAKNKKYLKKIFISPSKNAKISISRSK